MPRLPVKYDKRLMQVLGYRAVWEPGASISLGDIVTRKNGIFTDIDRLSDHGVTFRKETRKEAELSLNAQGVSETLFQFGAEVPSAADLVPSAKASLTIKFNSENSYHLKTTKLTGADIGNLAAVGRQIAQLDGWRFRDYYVVWRILIAKDFTFLGSIRRNREVSFSGTGKAIVKYLESGVSTHISRTRSMKLDLELIGATGPIAIGVTRFKQNGRPRDV